jgi:hypothetical protein
MIKVEHTKQNGRLISARAFWFVALCAALLLAPATGFSSNEPVTLELGSSALNSSATYRDTLMPKLRAMKPAGQSSAIGEVVINQIALSDSRGNHLSVASP